MKIWIIITIVAFFGFVLIILKGLHDARVFEEKIEKSLNNLEDEEVFSDLDAENEFSPEHLEVDKTLKLLSLKNKLDKISEERKQNDVDLDYQRVDGK